MVNTSGIHQLVARGRRRLKLQSALETGTLAVVPAVAAALVVVFLVRRAVLSEPAGLGLLAASGGLVLLGALVGYLRRYPTYLVATRIDRASGLHDRLANACAFESRLDRGDEPPETVAMMRAAVEDAHRYLPRADVKAATRFTSPREGRPALAFTAVAAIVAALYVPPPETDPWIALAEPNAAYRGEAVEVSGKRFCGPDSGDAREDGSCAGEPGGVLWLGEGDAAMKTPIVAWRQRTITFRVPRDAPIGETVLRVERAGVQSNNIDFEVLDPAKPRDPNDAVAFGEEDLEFQREMVDELHRTAAETGDEELERFADELDSLLDQAERGELTKEELLNKVAKAEEKYMKGESDDVEETMSELAKTGRELKKKPLTRELGKALEKGDLEAAQKQMEELAKKLENGELSERQREQVADAMKKAAEQFEKRQEQKDAKLDKKIAQKQQELQRLKKKMEQAKSEKKKEELARRQKRKKRELKRLEREKQQRQKSAQRRELKRLHRNMREASEDMRQKGQKNRRKASRRMRDMQRNTGKIDQDRRRITNQKKVASQMSDLKEAMRRARQRQKGMRDRFGKNRKNSDFRRRARGRKGSRKAWKPGSGKQGRLGKNGKGGKKGGNKPGQGKGKGGSSYGDSHDPDLLGDPTAKGGHTEDVDVQGVQGREGMSMRETILSSAEKGFARRAYKKVYAKYKTIVEEVIKSEKVPSGYKYYVKKYFQKIKPHAM